MDVEKKLQTIIREANQEISLKPNEKEVIRANIVTFIKANPVSVTPVNQPKAVFLLWSAFPFKAPALRYATLVALVTVVFAGGAVSYASQRALPGEALYPVKVGVNEKVLSFITFSEEQKAEYDVRLAQTRLEEMETVVAKNGESDDKTAQVKKLLDKHIASASARAERISRKNQPEVSAKIHSELEASLQAHENVLNALVGANGKIQAKKMKEKQVIDDLVSGLKTSAKEAVRAREHDEKRLSGNNNASATALNNVEVPAQKRLEAAQRIVVDFTSLFNDKKATMSVEAQAQATLAIENANGLIAQGQVKMGVEDFAGAFADFQQAIRVVQEARIHLNASTHFNISVPNILN